MIKNHSLMLIFLSIVTLLSSKGSNGLDIIANDSALNNIVLGHVYDWDELSTKSQDSLLIAVKKFVNLVGENKIEESYNSTHSRFKKIVNTQQYYGFFNVISSTLTSYDNLTFIKGKKAVFNNPPVMDQFISGGSMDETSPNHLKVQVIKGIKSQATLIFENTERKVSYYFVAVLGIENGEYRLYHLGLNPSSVHGRSFHFYSNYADKWTKEGKYLPAIFARLFAFKLVSYASTTQDNNTVSQITEFTKLAEKNPEKSTESWIVNGEKITYIEFDVQELEDDVVLEIKYVSNKELIQENATEEARKLMTLLNNQFPELKQVFPRILFTAYDKYPEEGIHFKTLRTPLYFNIESN